MQSSVDTPLMRQYLEVKRQYADALLLFRMGDFYEMFFDDAVSASAMLELTLTSRDKGKEDPVPMCGVPHHAVGGYVRKLLDRGVKVAICDQVEDPRTARGLVKRAVTRVITPGVVLDTDHLEAGLNNYLAVLVVEGGRIGLAAFDLSTFDLRGTELCGTEGVADELARLRPKEVIWLAADAEQVRALQQGAAGSWHPIGSELAATTPAQDRELLLAKGGEELGWADAPLALRAVALALRYAETTQPATGIPTCRIQIYQPSDQLQLDESSLANLELFESLMERRREGSLLWVLDATLTAMGARMMRQILSRPLLDVAAIRRRHDAVEILVEQANVRSRLREALRWIHDLERLTSRTVLQVITPRELARLRQSLEQLPQLGRLLAELHHASLTCELPESLACPSDLLEDVARELAEALVDEPPATAKEGGFIREGYSAELDELIHIGEGGRAEILAIEAMERARTGISSLKVRFNRVFGYFIEVTKSNLRHVPADYHRKQTLANAERFTTTALAEYEAKVLGAEERRVSLEQELFERLRQRVAAQAERLSAVARWVATLDALCGLAHVAQANDYVRPDVDGGATIAIEDGRHPVVERFLAPGQFVPNDITLDPEAGRLLILTGPNMAGKSTVMRQVALIVLMAQAGSFVPARRARIGVVDRIFTRVGASDNLARGESTFMVEMRETASILRHATPRSLIVVDEIGRGTATYDGISIAWAVAEYLHDRVRAKALFATHYHELCALAEARPFVQNFNIAVQEWKGKVVFLRKLVAGSSNRSYGIEVARLAGLDPQVVARARQVLAALEQGDHAGEVPVRRRIADPAGTPQLSLFEARQALPPADAALLEELRRLDTDQMTPLAALSYLAALVERVRHGEQANALPTQRSGGTWQ